MKSKISIQLPVEHTAEYARILLSNFQSFKLTNIVDMEYGEWKLRVPKGQYAYKLKDILSCIPDNAKCSSNFSFELMISMEYDDELMSDVPACDDIA